MLPKGSMRISSSISIGLKRTTSRHVIHAPTYVHSYRTETYNLFLARACFFNNWSTNFCWFGTPFSRLFGTGHYEPSTLLVVSNTNWKRKILRDLMHAPKLRYGCTVYAALTKKKLFETLSQHGVLDKSKTTQFKTGHVESKTFHEKEKFR